LWAPAANPRPSPSARSCTRALLSAFGAVSKTSADEQKALFVASDPEGGDTVGSTMADAIRIRVKQVSPIRQIDRLVNLQVGDSFEEPVFDDPPEAQWVGEIQSRPTTATPNVRKTVIGVHDIYANPPISQKLLDTATYDIGATLVNVIAKAHL
jgi:HK97 family phage major capsid protein